MLEARELCTFRLDRLHFGVDVGKVKGIVPHQPLTRVPLGPPAVRGLINLRGEIIACVDLRPCLDIEPNRVEDRWVNIVLKGSSGLVSLLVDEIGDVASFAENQFEPPPETMPQRIREITEGICRADDKIMLLLDVERTIAMASGTNAEI